MKLKEWRLAKKQTLLDFAKMVGSTEATISRIENGKNFPSFKLAGRINVATSGRVTPNDFCGI